MFTGIIEGIGRVIQVEKTKTNHRLVIEAPFSFTRDRVGDSVAVNGCCLTLTDKNRKSFSVDVSQETLRCTNLEDLKRGDGVNLERALRLQDRLGGHWVQGHIDGVAVLKSRKEVIDKNSKMKKFLILEWKFPASLQKYLVVKGSITLDGVSLTINQVDSRFFKVCLIPHTQERTTLTSKKVGDRVNLEVDVLAKYVESLMKK